MWVCVGWHFIMFELLISGSIFSINQKDDIERGHTEVFNLDHTFTFRSDPQGGFQTPYEVDVKIIMPTPTNETIYLWQRLFSNIDFLWDGTHQFNDGRLAIGNRMRNLNDTIIYQHHTKDQRFEFKIDLNANNKIKSIKSQQL